MVFQNQYPGASTNMVEKHREMDAKGTVAKRVLIVTKRGTSQGTGVAQHADESVQNVISMVIMLVVAKEGKA